MVVLVDPSADKQDLPRFRPPKVKSLRHACLVLIEVAYKGYNGDIGKCDLARGSGGEYECLPGQRPSQPLCSRAGSRESFTDQARVTIREHYNRRKLHASWVVSFGMGLLFGLVPWAAVYLNTIYLIRGTPEGYTHVRVTASSYASLSSNLP